MFSLKRRSISLAGRIHAKTQDVILATLWWVSAIIVIVGLLSGACALRPSPVQMYEGPSLPKEQVGIVRGACQTGLLTT